MTQVDDTTPFDALAAVGVYAVPAPTNNFEVRTDSVDTLLRQLIGGKPSLTVCRRCTGLIKGLAGAYQFRRVAVAGMDRFHDKPDKGPLSHVSESLAYLLLGAGVGGFIGETWKSAYDEIESDPDFDGWYPDQRLFG